MARLKLEIIIKYILVFSIIFNLIEFSVIIKENYFLNKQKKILEAQLEKNKKFDARTIWDAYKDFNTKDPNIFFYLGPIEFKEDKNEILPLSIIAKENIFLYANDHGYYPVYKSDRYGFKNLDIEWEKKIIDYVLVGDSFLQPGNIDKSIGHHIRSITLTQNGILDLSHGSFGPLYQYAVLREYLPLINAKKVILFYFESNDLTNLQNHLKNSILQKYLKNIKFTQNLHLKQKIINKIYEDKHLSKSNKFNNYTNNRTWLEEIEDYKKNNWLLFFKYYHTRKILFKQKKQNKKKVEDYLYVLDLINKFVDQNDAKLYFVYVPEINRYIDGVPIRRASQNYKKILKGVKNLNIEYLDLHKEFYLKQKNPLIYFPLESYGHVNELGFNNISQILVEKFN
jgi:hypothetical protein